MDATQSGNLHQIEQLPFRVCDPRLVAVQLNELVRKLPHFLADKHQFGFAPAVRRRGGERHDLVVVLYLLHGLSETVTDVRADLRLHLFADPLDCVLGDDVIQTEPFGSAVFEFVFDGIVLRGTERPV